MQGRVKFVCSKCNKPILCYKTQTSTRRKCSSCGSYHVKSIAPEENSHATAVSAGNSNDLGISASSQAGKVIPCNAGELSDDKSDDESICEQAAANNLNSVNTPGFVSIIIVNHNGKPYLSPCLDAISNLDYPKTGFEVIVVDNCSNDGSVSYLKENYSWVSVLICAENNYSKANNQGIKFSKGEYIVLLNNDTVVDQDWLKELVNTMNAHQDAGAVGSKVLFENGLIQSTGHQEYPNFEWGDRGYNEKDTGQYETEEEVESLCGVSLMLRKKCLDKVGLLDEDFVFYMEDVDLALRMRKEGWKLYYSPKSKLVHKYNGTGKILFPEQTNKLEREYTERNRLLFVAKHYPDQLSKALTSFPYFYIDKDFSVIYDSIPLVIATVLKHHGQEKAIEVLSPLFDNIKKVMKLERSSFIKEKHSLQSQINALYSEIAEKEKATARARDLSDRLQNSLQEKSGEVEVFKKDLFDSRARVVSLSGEVEVFKKDLFDSRARVVSLSGEVEVFKKDLFDSRARVVSLSDENDLLSENKRAAEEKIYEIKSNISSLTLEIERLKESLLFLRDEKLTSEELLKSKLAESEAALSVALSELQMKEDALNSICTTRLYKHVCTPIWKIHNSVRKKRKDNEQNE